MLLLNSFLLWLLLYYPCLVVVIEAAAAGGHGPTNGAENCFPRCCSPGQILDQSGTACLKNTETQIQGDPCGRRDSFLPKCELENEEKDEGKNKETFLSSVTRKLFVQKLLTARLGRPF